MANTTTREASAVGGTGMMRLCLTLARVLPPRFGYALSEGLGRLAGRVLVKRRAILESNLIPVLETADRRQLRRVAVEIFAHAMRSYYDNLFMPFASREAVANAVVFDPHFWPQLVEMKAQGQPIILVVTHQSSYDLPGQVLAARGYPLSALALATPASSFTFLNDLRRQQGINVLPASPHAIRHMVRTLREGGTIALGGDRPVKGQGVEVEFFGRPTILPDAHIRLAMHTGAHVVGAFCRRREGEYHVRGYLHELVTTGNQEEDVRENVQRFARVMEGAIREHPEQWHLFLRLWE